MAARKTLYVTSRDDWRDWLTKHCRSETEVWLIYSNKDSVGRVSRTTMRSRRLSCLEQNTGDPDDVPRFMNRRGETATSELR